MNTRGWNPPSRCYGATRMEEGEWQSGSIVECGGKRSATPLWETGRRDEKRRRRCAMPAQSKTWRIWFVALLALISVFSFQFSAFSQSYAIDWDTIDGGGGTSTGGVYSVSGTIGQPDAGPTMTNSQYSVTGGFWALPQAVQTAGAPTLIIVSVGPAQAQISWTPGTGTNWVLQETISLSPANWTYSPSGSTNPIVIPATLPAKFYRLSKP